MNSLELISILFEPCDLWQGLEPLTFRSIIRRWQKMRPARSNRSELNGPIFLEAD